MGCPRVPFRASALHSIPPTVWLVHFVNGQPAGPSLLYAEGGDTLGRPHRPPAQPIHLVRLHPGCYCMYRKSPSQ